MGRKKGFKLSAEHKRKMAEGRAKAKEKAMEGIIGDEESVRRSPKRDRKETLEVKIIGYSFDKGDKVPFPIFSSEKRVFTGRLYKTCEEALQSMRVKSK